MSGLPKSYIKKHHGDLKAAWKDYRGGGSHSPTTHHKPHHPSHSSAGEGGGSVNASRPGGADLKTVVRSRLVSEIDPSTLGAIIYGMLEELEAPLVMDASDVIPTVFGQRQQSAQSAAVSDEKAAWLSRFREDIMIGREAVRTGAMGKVMMTLGISAAKGSQHYAAALRRVSAGGGGAVAMGGGAFTPPFDAPTVVTSPFGAQRAGGYHRGVDLRAAIGTPVHAPYAARVDDVFTEDEGGNVVRLALQRPDGGYAAETSMSDDSGLLVSFLHLQSAAVKKGDVVNAGDVVAYSGNTGRNTDGPHLHVAAEYFNDAPAWGLDSNSRVFVDPAALYGGTDAMTSGAQPVAFVENQVMQGLVIPRDDGGNPLQSLFGGGSPSGQPTTLTITNSGALAIGGGNAVNTNIKAVLPLGEAFRGGTGDGGLSHPPIPDALRGVAQQVTSVGGNILHGIGGIAGQVFARVTSPQGIATIARLGGQAAQGLGALAPVLGGVAAAVGPFLAAIPYVGPFLATAAEVGGPAAAILGPILGAVGGAVANSGAPQSIGDVMRRGQAGGAPAGPLQSLFPS